MPSRPSPRKVRSGTGSVGEIDEDEAGPDLAVHRRHPQLALVEVEELILIGDVVDHAVQPVSPAVVLAGEGAAAARRLLCRVLLPDHLVAAVGAHIVERVHVVVEVAGDHDRRQLAGQLAGEVRPLAWQPFDPPDAQPVSLEHGLALGGEELLRDRVFVVDRRGAELGVVGGELAAAGGQPLLDAGHECDSFFAACRCAGVLHGCWSQARSSGAISPPNGKNARWA